MSRYEQMFAALRRRQEGAFGAFLMLGDPNLDASAKLLDAVAGAGADMIEVGIPFSDPIADGPVIQAAADRALGSGTRVDDCFGLLSGFRKRHPQVPIGILTYANLVAARGIDRFSADAAAAGVDSLLVADVPAMEAAPFAAAARRAGVDFVMIAAPNTPPSTLATIGSLASGYTYCVARAGVTGVRDKLSLDHARLFADLRALDAPPPVLGFGISTPDHVSHAIQGGAAGVITGSAIISLAAGATDLHETEMFVAAMKQATRLAG